MKLCWDNIENIRLSKFGNFRDVVKKITYYHKLCKKCGEEFLGKKKLSEFCCKKCINKNRKFTTDHKKKLSLSRQGIKLSNETKQKMINSHKGKKLSKEHIENISISKKGKNHPLYGKKGEKSANWKGGYNINDIPTYDTYAYQLEWCEEVRRNKKDPNILEVRCFKCDKWYMPILVNTQNRIQHLKGNRLNDQRFYCSDQCKNACSIYGKSTEQVMKEDAVRAGRLSWLELKREVQPELREMVLERDGDQCIKCESTNDLQCHHILPVNIEPLLSADIDNCITLCKECHIKVHKEVDGCGYNQLQIEEC